MLQINGRYGSAGARSQVANLFAAVLCLFTLVLLTPLFRNIPQPALAAIVIAAMLHLTRPSYLRDLFVRSRWSLANTVIVIAGELTLGVLHGIALGVVLSLLLLIYQTSHPRGSELGQLPESEAYRNVIPLPYRVESKSFTVTGCQAFGSRCDSL
jgi:sulfate permease, SulP family